MEFVIPSGEGRWSGKTDLDLLQGREVTKLGFSGL